MNQLSEKSEPLFWSYKECSYQTGIAIGTLYSLVSQKRIPHNRIGKRHVVFPVSKVKDWIDSNPFEQL